MFLAFSKWVTREQDTGFSASEGVLLDVKLFVDTWSKGAPFATVVAGLAVVWDLVHTYLRERSQDKQAKQELALEVQKFNHQQQLEEKKFEYEKSRWREQLAREITVRLVEVRLDEYSQVWSHLQGIAESKRRELAQSTKEIAERIQQWRYSKGGLLAEEITRDAAYVLQQALWDYDGSEIAWRRILDARHIFRDAIRADIGLTEAIFQVTEDRQKVRQALDRFKAKLSKETQQSLPLSGISSPKFSRKCPARFPARSLAVLCVFRGAWGFGKVGASCSKYRYPNG